ncbi:MAG: NAD(FAD)-utilizing dehydrogenase [Bacillota bacterium]|nr:NAD(FAD)-utilizing dehydrogenase [Bacillota bacterium]
MRYKISQIKLDPDQSHEDLEQAILKKLRRNVKIRDISIVRESIDARRKPDVKLVYTLEFSCDRKLPLEQASKKEYKIPGCSTEADGIKAYKAHGKEPESKDRRRPIVAGFGPCGIFAALILAEAGLNPVVIERGEPVEKRIKTVERFWQEGILDPESNVQFGEGGAGTFSDGKLTTGIKDIRIGRVLQEFVEAGADKSILYKQRPHIGTDKLRDVVKNLRHRIEHLGGEIRFNTKLTDLVTEEKDGRHLLAGIYTETGGAQDFLETDRLILAIGHSARDTFRMLLEKGLNMEQKPFSIGVRIQHPQKLIDKAQYGDPSLAERLGPADYKLNHRCRNGRGVYTFCMCPGGQIINASSEPETAVTNGMSNSVRDGRFANSGLLVDVRTEDFPSEHPLAGVEFQRMYERRAYEAGAGDLPETDYGSFKSSTEDPVRRSLPDFAIESILEAMPFLGKKLRGFDREDAVMRAVETRSSSPVRIRRNDDYNSSITGVLPAGEGPGYAGGIMSAAVDGIKAAEKIISQQ